MSWTSSERLMYVQFTSCIYWEQMLFNQNLFLETLNILSISKYFFKLHIHLPSAYIFQTEYIFLFSIKFSYEIILFQLAYMFSNSNMFFSYYNHGTIIVRIIGPCSYYSTFLFLFHVTMYIFQSGILFSISSNIFDKSQIYFPKIINIFCKRV